MTSPAVGVMACVAIASVSLVLERNHLLIAICQEHTPPHLFSVKESSASAQVLPRYGAAPILSSDVRVCLETTYGLSLLVLGEKEGGDRCGCSWAGNGDDRLGRRCVPARGRFLSHPETHICYDRGRMGVCANGRKCPGHRLTWAGGRIIGGTTVACRCPQHEKAERCTWERLLC